MLDNAPLLNYLSRDQIIGHPTAYRVSDFGCAQFKHFYNERLLSIILTKAKEIKDQAVNKHLDLTFITGAQRYIPEINQLLHDPARLENISNTAQANLSPYPHDIVSTTITFMGPISGDNTINWHMDGVPVTELIPLEISDDIDGGDLQIYMGNGDYGQAMLEEFGEIPQSETTVIPHKVGYSTLGQFIRVQHRTTPIIRGARITLVLNSMSKEKAYVDDNNLHYLLADNDHDKSDWRSSIFDYAKNVQLPAYRDNQQAIIQKIRLLQQQRKSGLSF